MQQSILIFEDDETTMELCAIICEGLDLKVFQSATTENVVQQVKNYQPDIILMDYWIPGMGGLKAIAAIKNNQEVNSIPIIFFSANKDFMEVVPDSLADDYIQKPFELNDLEQKILNLLNPSKKVS